MSIVKMWATEFDAERARENDKEHVHIAPETSDEYRKYALACLKTEKNYCATKLKKFER